MSFLNPQAILVDAHSRALVPQFSSADLEPHHFGKPARRGFQFGMVAFLRTAFDLPTVQSNSLVNMCPVSSCGVNH